MSRGRIKIVLGSTCESNLRVLASYLLTGIKKGTYFDMSEFDDTKGRWNNTTCGTIGCAVGHAPYAGLRKKRKKETWPAYSEEVFGICPYENVEIWDWMFDYRWADIDNTPEGAARRILYALEKGVPKDMYNNALYKDQKPLTNSKIQL